MIFRWRWHRQISCLNFSRLSKWTNTSLPSNPHIGSLRRLRLFGPNAAIDSAHPQLLITNGVVCSLGSHGIIFSHLETRMEPNRELPGNTEIDLVALLATNVAILSSLVLRLQFSECEFLGPLKASRKYIKYMYCNTLPQISNQAHPGNPFWIHGSSLGCLELHSPNSFLLD